MKRHDLSPSHIQMLYWRIWSRRILKLRVAKQEHAHYAKFLLLSPCFLFYFISILSFEEIFFISALTFLKSSADNVLYVGKSYILHKVGSVTYMYTSTVWADPRENQHYGLCVMYRPGSAKACMPRRLTRTDTVRLLWIFCFRNHYSIPLSLWDGICRPEISLHGLRILIWVDTLRRIHNVGFSRGTAYLSGCLPTSVIIM